MTSVNQAPITLLELHVDTLLNRSQYLAVNKILEG